MEKLEHWLRTRPLVFSLLLAAVVCYVLGTNGVISEDAMPFGDGEHYVMRSMMLYGYLHSGQWAQFWNLFTLPKQSLVLPHYLLFFLLPQSWASMTSYGITQVVTTYGLLAIGIWTICRSLDRVMWTPALFLLCASQNISLDESYFYFVDASFLAFGTLALGWQIRAWRNLNWRSSVLSGAGAAVAFWIKPSNGMLFIGTYFLAELFRIGLAWYTSKKDDGTKSRWYIGSFCHIAGVIGGFVPVLLVAILCGGYQAVILSISTNEVTGFFSTTLECTGLLRFLYFPLCLTFFYHTFTILFIFAGMGFVAYKMRRNGSATPPAAPTQSFPAQLLIPILLAYFIAGEIFSFEMAFKSMRFVLIIVPVFWLAIFWIFEKWHLRPTLVFLAVSAYVLCGYSQVLFNSYESQGVSTESYQLKGDWFSRFPNAHVDNPSGMAMTKDVLAFIHQGLPDGGKIAIGTEQLYLTSESLSWASQYEPALHGQPFPYQFNNFLTVDGQFARKSLMGANGILVFVAPSFQYSRPVMQASVALVEYGLGTWTKADDVQMLPFQPAGQDPMAYLIVPKEPLTAAKITELIAGARTTELTSGVDFGSSTDHRYTWQECMDLLQRWKQKRLGQNQP